MIISTGVDLAEVDRIQAAIEHPRIGWRFRDRVFTAGEIAYCEKNSAASPRVRPDDSRLKKR